MARVSGFRFKLREKGSTRWVWLRGSGGRIGDGALHIQKWDRRTWDRVRARLLVRVRAELERSGEVWEHIPTPEGPVSFETRIIHPEAIEDCQAVWSGGVLWYVEGSNVRIDGGLR